MKSGNNSQKGKNDKKKTTGLGSFQIESTRDLR